VPSNGESTTVAVLETGSFFGEMSLFSGEPRSADVVAIEEVAVLEIRKSSVRRLLIENTKLAEAFSKKVTERHASLNNYASSIQREEPNVEQERLLQRIKRFFNLS
jgi:CRP-like cAMP-binding protein